MNTNTTQYQLRSQQSLILIVLGLVCFIYSSVVHAQNLEVHRKAIRNGSLTPQNIYLNDTQTRAIGWLYRNSTGVPIAFCTATVVTKDLIVTARHCFENEETGAYEFPVGEIGFATLSPAEMSADGELIDPQIRSYSFTENQLKIHETLDVAIIRYPTLVFQDPTITPIPINQTSLEDGLFTSIIDQKVDIAGFGATYLSDFDNNQNIRFFTSVHVELINSRSLIVNGEFNQGVCGGDSGGPLLSIGSDGGVKVIAVVSKGDPCCAGLDQITRVDILYDWIQSNSFDLPILEQRLPKECWGIGKSYTCKGDTLLSCDSGVKQMQECQELGSICDFDKVRNQFTCVQQTNCGEVTRDGRCNNNTVERCEDGEIVYQDCGQTNVCQTIEGKGTRVACVDVQAYNFPESNPGRTPTCDPNNLNRLDDIAQAKFIGVASCQTLKSPKTISDQLTSLFFMLIFGLSYRYKNHLRNH